MNFFKKYKDRSTIKRITFTSVFFGLVILFQYLETFMPFGGTFIKFNFSLLFILPIFYFAGPLYGILVILLRFIMGITMKGGWASLPIITSHLILLVSTSVAIIFMYIYSSFFSKVKNHNKKNIYISVATVLSTALVLTLLNAIWFTPMYISSFPPYNTYRYMFDIPKAINAYNTWMKPFHFGIPNYWGGIFAVYLAGNIIKFTLVYLVNYPLSKVIRHYY